MNNIETLIILEKLGKAASNAIANKIIILAINQDLVDTTKQREKRRQENQKNSIDRSYSWVIRYKKIEQQKVYHLNKRFIETIQ